MLGVFGDSYGVPNYFFRETSWPAILSNYLNLKCENHAGTGTSIFWSYKKFLQHYKKYKVIVFVYSGVNRWLSLPEHLKNDW